MKAACETARRGDGCGHPARLVAITQVLTGWGGGILGVLGAYVGYSFRGRHDDDQH